MYVLPKIILGEKQKRKALMQITEWTYQALALGPRGKGASKPDPLFEVTVNKIYVVEYQYEYIPIASAI